MSYPIKVAVSPSQPLRPSARSQLPSYLVLLLLIVQVGAAPAHAITLQRALRPQQPTVRSGAITPKETEVRTLEAGEPVKRELAGGETHSYKLILTSGQYARVVVDQRRINVAVTAFDP